MSELDALRALADGLVNTGNAMRAALAVPTPPVVSPTPAPTPALAPAPRQLILAWVGADELDMLSRGAPSGVTLDRCHGAIDGFVVRDPGPGMWPDVTDTWKAVTARGFSLRCCVRAVDGTTGAPFVTDLGDVAQRDALHLSLSALRQFVDSVGGTGLAFDLEPYERDRSMWDWRTFGADELVVRATMHALGLSIAPVASPCIVYPSSDASWPGSYGDVAEQQAGNGALYTDSLMPDFIEGLMAGGAVVTHSDSTFHWGPQVKGMTWATGIADSVNRAHAEFPAIEASAMLWPDNDEGHGPFPVDEMRVAFDAATRLSTGPVVLYQHTLAHGGADYPWTSLLDMLRGLR